ncbi:MAG: single-stranded-DNA-specific exonuclease RecJ [Porticoccaceae bacterium]
MAEIVARAELTDLELSGEPLLQRLYRQRGISQVSDLDYSLKSLPDPQQLLGVEAAVERLEKALAMRQSVLIVGDFDADGATSCALMVLALQSLGACVDFIVPDRFTLGYGLSPAIVDIVAEQHCPDLIITVDNGIASIEGVCRAATHNIDVIITDHHLPGAELPAAVAIVNPNQPGCQFPSKAIAGVGVAFYLLLALRSKLRKKGFFRERPEPNLAHWLDLVALGTVADVVPLDKLNRSLIHHGIQRIRAARCRPGILALLQLAGRDPSQLQASDLGFTVGPRLNAAGRLDNMTIGIDCLLAESPQQAHRLASELDALNRERRAIEQGMQSEALADLETEWQALDTQQLPALLVLYRPEWHEGIVGLLASRIKERYHRPTVVFTDSESGDLKGSARSIEGLHIRDLLDELANSEPGLIEKFGGHAMAAGLTLPAGQLERFRTAVVALASVKLTVEQLQAKQFSDGPLAEEDLSLACAEKLRRAGPWGQQFPAPQFDGPFNVVAQRIVGERHIKLTLKVDAQAAPLEAIWFNVPSRWLSEPLPEFVEVLYRLDVNHFRGRSSLQLMIEQLEPGCG